MPRFLTVCFCMVAILFLSGRWTTAQESEQSPAPHSRTTHQFELPGIDFPFGAKIVVKHAEGNDEQIEAAACIDIECECLKSSGVPFLSNIPHVNKLFTNVGGDSCTKINIDVCDESGCPHTPADESDECTSCPSKSTCKSCEGCPVAKVGIPIEGHDRWFAAVNPPAKSCQPCAEGSKCEQCEFDCPANRTIVQASAQPRQPGKFVYAGFNTAIPNSSTCPVQANNQEIFELRLENERLKMEIKAADDRVELMESIMEIREENAVLRTRIEFYEAAKSTADNQ